MSEDLARMDATAQAELVASGEASPAELVEAAIARAESVNPELNAIVHELYDEGRDAAAGELPAGPFRGVPFLLKDLGAMQAGQPLHMGMKLLKQAGFRAPGDSYLGARFREAGLVTIGKTNVPELGIKPVSESLAYGPARNPWDTGRSPGGSSGGAGAAVAAGIVPVAHASDGGGSIRIPASHGGLVGLKPTRMRISSGPAIGDFASGLNEDFVLTRSVRDCAALLDAVAGPAPGDPYAAPPPQRRYSEELDADPSTLRVLLVTEPGIESVPDPEAVAAARSAAELLDSLGHTVEDGGPVIPADLDMMGTFTLRFAAGHAGVIATLEIALGREITAADLEPLTGELVRGARARSAADYVQAVGLHQIVARQIAALFERFDLILSPTVGAPPPAVGLLDDDPERPISSYERALPWAMFSAPFNATGQPAISLPLHWTDDGLPIGAQLAAPMGREDLLISIAAQLERARPWSDRTPPVFAAGITA